MGYEHLSVRKIRDQSENQSENQSKKSGVVVRRPEMDATAKKQIGPAKI